MEDKNCSFTQGPILPTLIRFALPVLAALFLQTLYGAVDLLVVGQFSAAAEVSGVATGSQLMSTATVVINGLSMGLAAPASSFVQILLCMAVFVRYRKRDAAGWIG